MEKTIEETNKNFNHPSRNELMISVDNNGKIIKFNEVSEKISGHSQYETLNKIFLDFIVPKRYSKQWTNIFHSLEENRLIDDFKLPILTKNGYEIMVSWSCFPVKDQSGNIGDISLVGKLINSWDDNKESYIGVSKDNNMTYEGNEDFFRIYKELENKNKELEREVEQLRLKKSGKNIFSLFVSKKSKEEFEDKLHEIEERERSLILLENKLEQEKKSLNEQRNWFVEWRKKLEDLEFEIENRRLDTIKIERNPEAFQLKAVEEKLKFTEEDAVDIFEDISECAAIIQRGIIKKVNEPFINLIGYNYDEIQDKSLFDFINPEGFPGLENYYLHRLKGIDVTDFNTIFLTKDNKKISVSVKTRPTTFNDDKAEIVIFKKIKLKKYK